jgi:hypothetical protein
MGANQCSVSNCAKEKLNNDKKSSKNNFLIDGLLKKMGDKCSY